MHHQHPPPLTYARRVQVGALDGLYIGSDTLTGDYATVLYRLQLLGFNAIRLPFSFQVLFNQQPTSFTRPCTTTSLADIQENITPPGVSVPSGAKLPALVRRVLCMLRV